MEKNRANHQQVVSEVEHSKKKMPQEDILEIVKQFINYFEEADRSESDGNRVNRGERF